MMVMEIEETKVDLKKTPIKLDWNKLLSSNSPPPPEVVVVSEQTTTEEQRLKLQQDFDYISTLRDTDLELKINRIRSQIDNASFIFKLPDKGNKLLINLNYLEQEREQRRRRRIKDAEHEESTRNQKSGTLNGVSSGAPSSLFCAIFSEKLEEKPDLNTRITVDASSKGSLRLNTKSDRTRSNKGKSEIKSTSRHIDMVSPLASRKSFEPSSFYENRPGRSSKRKKTSTVQTLLRSRTKEPETVDLVDEEDCQLEGTTNQEDEPVDRIQANIFYPSRDDPECGELHYSDVERIASPAFMSCKVMNFYIRYLQQTASRSDYHFFCTYFYEKIKKRNDKEFPKLRKWWKGVNLFEKAYIFLPINKDYHWSLVIICLPNMEDESRLTILHLDSLGYHASGQIFQNVKSFLREEWNYVDNSDLSRPQPLNTRRFLTRKIDEKKITVPQQKNDYDCGIFVLYYMERFIAERRIKKEIPKFGKQWFKPEEASCLRGKIRKLLEKHFNNPNLENEKEETSSTSSSDDSAGSCKDVIDMRKNE